MNIIVLLLQTFSKVTKSNGSEFLSGEAVEVTFMFLLRGQAGGFVGLVEWVCGNESSSPTAMKSMPSFC